MTGLRDWFQTPPGQVVLAWERERFDAALAAAVDASRPDLVVLMLGLGELYDRRVAGKVVEFGEDGGWTVGVA